MTGPASHAHSLGSLSCTHDSRLALGRDLLNVTPGRVLLSGDLEVFDATSLLQLLGQARRTGLLIAGDDEATRAIILSRGRLVWATSTRTHERVSEILCRLDVAHRAFSLLETTGSSLGALLERQVTAVVRGLIGARRGRFTLLELLPPAALGEGIDPQRLLLALCEDAA